MAMVSQLLIPLTFPTKFPMKLCCPLMWYLFLQLFLSKKLVNIFKINWIVRDESPHLRTNLDTTDIISLLNFVLSGRRKNYFIYDGIYKQIHGCAMGSPVSPVVANLCMEALNRRDGHQHYSCSIQSMETIC